MEGTPLGFLRERERSERLVNLCVCVCVCEKMFATPVKEVKEGELC